MFMLAGAAISQCSRKQQSTALLIVEAEYLVVSHTAKEAPWLRHFLKNTPQASLPKNKIFKVDKQDTMALTRKQVTLERNKHMYLNYFSPRENAQEGKPQLQYS